MTCGKIYYGIAAVMVIVAISNSAAGKNTHFGIIGGVSVPASEGHELWNAGYTLGGHAFYQLSSTFLIGGRLAYNRWTPNEDEVLEDLQVSGDEWKISGHLTSLEVTPAIRMLAPLGGEIRFFGQLGLGYFHLDSKATVEWVPGDIEVSDEDSSDEFGLNVGWGLTSLGRPGFELMMVLYNFVLTEGSTTKYLTIGAGMTF